MAEPQGLMAKTQMPNFSILGMLLGGRGYASDWFSTRDKLQLQQAATDTEAANRSSSVDRLMGGDEWKKLEADPYSSSNLAGIFSAGNKPDIDPKTAGVMTDLFQTGMANVYGRMNQDYGQKLTQENLVAGAKVDLATTREKQRLETEGMVNQWKAAFGDNPQVMQTLMQGKVMKDSGINVPGGYLPTMIDGQIAAVPQFGSDQYNNTVAPVLAQSQLTQQIDTLVNGADNGTLSQGAVQALRNSVMDSYRVANKLGTLDAGAMEFMDQMFPKNFMAGNWSPTDLYNAKETWRTVSLIQKQKLTDMKKYTVLPFDVNATPLGGADRPNPADAAARIKAEREQRQKAIEGPQSNPRFGNPKVSGGQTGKTIFDAGAPAKTRTGGAY